MYENIGEKIQTIAKVMGVLCLILSILVLIVCMTDGQANYLGWILVVAGVIGFLSSWILYGFGELIQETTSIRHHLAEIENLTRRNRS